MRTLFRTDLFAEDSWQRHLLIGYQLLCEELQKKVDDPDKHFSDTPRRIVKNLTECYWGIHEDPRECLEVQFTETRYDQMIWVKDMPFSSWCRHHFLPFFGVAHFAYLPNKSIVGLSKIGRLLSVLAARPQLQENLAQEMVEVFADAVKPMGCGVVLEARHTCMSCRGIQMPAVTRTVALDRDFMVAAVKAEFLGGIK